MKKGFTLIELLAVILILGIIALIAIPTVNNIISEARYGAFKSGNDNIMKTIEQDCQTSIMKGENPTLSYLFTEGKVNNKINIKGALPTDGYILMNKNCETINYYLTDGKNIYSNGEDVRNDYMLKASSDENTSLFKTMYLDYFDNIISISFVNNLDIPGNAIEVKDPSISGNNKIRSWLVSNGEYYDLYVGSLNKIYANKDSSNLFSNLSNVININFSNFSTSFVSNMNKMFENDKNLEYIDVFQFDVSNVTTMRSMFNQCNNVLNLDVSNWDTSNVNDMYELFQNCFKITSLDVSNWNTSNVVNMQSLFAACKLLSNINVSSWDTSNVTNMYQMFAVCNNLKTVNTKNFNTSKVENMGGMFRGCHLLKTIDLSNFDTRSLTRIGGIFEDCKMLEEVNLSSFIINDDTTLSHLFYACNNLKKIIILDGTTLNKIISSLPDRNTSAAGEIIIVNDKTGIDTNALSLINWNVV